MSLKDSFLSALITAPKLSPGQKPEDFLGQIFFPEYSDGFPLLYLLSCGNIKAASPWTFDIAFMDCYLFLYTKKGCGKLTLGHKVFSLDASSLLFLDCRQRIRFDIATAPWEYQVFFCAGNNLSYYYGLLPLDKSPVLRLLPRSETTFNLELLASMTPPFSLNQQLSISDLLNRITTQFVITLLKKPDTASQIPVYIKNMKNLFDNYFDKPYNLDFLEEYFDISKYRLCREFANAYHMSPMQYLNKKRIDYAAHLLLTTNYRVQEIGNMAGIENTNHFINLFKKYYGITPLEYRRQMAL